MKNIILILSVLLCSFGYSQNITDSTTIANVELVNINNHIKDLEDKIVIKDKIIDELKNQIFYHNQLHQSDSTYMYLQNEQIAVHNIQIGAYKDLYKSTKPKWYNSKGMGFVYGVGTIMGASWVLNNTK